MFRGVNPFLLAAVVFFILSVAVAESVSGSRRADAWAQFLQEHCSEPVQRPSPSFLGSPHWEAQCGPVVYTWQGRYPKRWSP